MTVRVIAEYIGFQVVWLACAFGAAAGTALPGLAAAGIFVVARFRAPDADRALGVVTLAATATGILAESLLVLAGLVRYASAWPTERLAPIWLAALWSAFGTLLPGLSRAFGSVPFALVAVIGAITGPLSYVAAARIGALELTSPGGHIAIGFTWGVALPALIALHRHLAPAARQIV